VFPGAVDELLPVPVVLDMVPVVLPVPESVPVPVTVLLVPVELPVPVVLDIVPVVLVLLPVPVVSVVAPVAPVLLPVPDVLPLEPVLPWLLAAPWPAQPANTITKITAITMATNRIFFTLPSVSVLVSKHLAYANRYLNEIRPSWVPRHRPNSVYSADMHPLSFAPQR
jgi:hypothetical protein